MSNISKKFSELKKANKTALIIFIEAGDPSLSVTEKLVYEIEGAGADIIELGVPFTDSIADGPTIQKAAIRSLDNDVSADDIFSLVTKIRKRSEIPLVLMTSYNIIFKYGVGEFIEKASHSKVDGLIVPDLPPEEGEELAKLAGKKGVNIIFLVAPNTPPERIKRIADLSTGFIYFISLTGITGARKSLAEGIKESVSGIRKHTDKPIAVGFGISNPSQAKELSKIADGIIVGSAVINVIEKNIKSGTMTKKVGAFVRSLKKGL